jgi:hypothetical protein
LLRQDQSAAAVRTESSTAEQRATASSSQSLPAADSTAADKSSSPSASKEGKHYTLFAKQIECAFKKLKFLQRSK